MRSAFPWINQTTADPDGSNVTCGAAEKRSSGESCVAADQEFPGSAHEAATLSSAHLPPHDTVNCQTTKAAPFGANATRAAVGPTESGTFMGAAQPLEGEKRRLIKVGGRAV